MSAFLLHSADGGEQATWSFTPFTQVMPGDKRVEPINVTLQNTRSVTVAVTDEAGKAVPQARVSLTGTQGAFDRSSFDGVTDDAGEFNVRMPEKFLVGYIYALKQGVGLDYHSYVKPPRTNDLRAKAPAQPADRVALVLSRTRPVKFKFVDDDGQPIAGLLVYPWYFHKPDETDDSNISGVQSFYTSTNLTGEATFDWIPAWQEQKLILWHRSAEFSDRAALVYDPKASSQVPLATTLHRVVELSGTLHDTAGQPVADATVVVSGGGYSYNSFRGTAKSDRDGRFRIDVPPYQLYMLAAYSADSSLASTVRDGIAVYPRKPLSGLDLSLQPATRVFGRLTLGSTNEPMKNYAVSLRTYEYNMKGVEFPPHDPKDHGWVLPTIVQFASTDSNGRFEFRAGPGKYSLLRGDPQSEVAKFEIRDQRELEQNFHIERADGPVSVALRGTVVSGSPAKPVQGALITDGGALSVADPLTDSNGMFEIDRRPQGTTLFAHTKDMSLGAVVEVKADDQTVTIPIGPTANYRARIVGEDGKPLPKDRQITYGVTVRDDPKNKFSPHRWCFGGTIHPEADGGVLFKGLAVGATYDVYLHNLDGNSYDRMTSISPNEPGEHDLGELMVKEQKPYHPPTFEERISGALKGRPRRPAQSRREGFARLADARVLITFANPEAPVTKALYKLYFEDDTLPRIVNDNYRTVAIPTGGEKRSGGSSVGEEVGRRIAR